MRNLGLTTETMKVADLVFKKERDYVKVSEIKTANGTLFIRKGYICRTNKNSPYEVDLIHKGEYKATESFVDDTRLQEIINSFMLQSTKNNTLK